MEREQIIKALELCRKVCSGANLTLCKECPLYEKKCSVALPNYALALIKELTEENERLENICQSYALQYGTATDKEVFLKQVRADTVRKMQERLKKCFDNEIEHMSIYTEKQVLFAIDQIAKEMLE